MIKKGDFAMPISTSLRLLVMAACLTISASGWAQAQSSGGPRPSVVVDRDGTVHAPAMAVPQSEFLSPEGKAYVTDHLLDMQNPAQVAQTDGVPAFMRGYIDRQHELYPVNTEDTHIAGVHAVVHTPKAGIAKENENRVLINLHGGGFMGCWPACATLESIPVASLGRIKVIALDYREAPEHTFPAASEDVASVYKELLKSYKPENIGIYGCSAGGMLAGEAISWFIAHDLPVPGAAGMFCSGLTISATGFGGDAGYFTLPIGEGRVPPRPEANQNARTGMPYFKGADTDSPLISVANYPKVLAKFPPSLIITASRDFAFSSAVHTHAELVKAGAEADLHVWDGLFHGFFYNPDVPESQDAYAIMVGFFDRHLGRE